MTIFQGYDTESLIELSGASWSASHRVRLKDLHTNVKLASGPIDSPVGGIVLTVPPDFSRFILRGSNFKLSVSDVLALAFSYDGGKTFLFDNTSYNAYNHAWVDANVTGAAPGAVSSNAGASDSLIILGSWSGFASWNADSPIAVDFIVDINPGSSDNYASLFFEGITVAPTSVGDNKFEYARGWACDEGGLAITTAPHPPARITHIILQPYGDGAAPQGSGHLINAGSYSFQGCP